MNTDWRQTVTNQQTILTVIAGLTIPAIITLLTQSGANSISERRLLAYAVVSLAIHIPTLLLTAHNDRKTSFMISQGQIGDPWRIVLSHINNILYPIVNFSVLATWLFLLLIVFNRINLETPSKSLSASPIINPPRSVTVHELPNSSNKDINRLSNAYIVNNTDSFEQRLSTIGTLLAVTVALLGITEIRSWVFKPLIRRQEARLQKTEQRNEKGQITEYQRLIIKNINRRLGRSAKDVRVFLTYANREQSGLEDFIPIPLRWTYLNSFARNISRGEPAYLDVFTKEKGNTAYNFCWADVAGSGSANGILKEFKPDFGDLRLEFYERNGGLIGDMILKYFTESDYFEVIDSRQ